MEPEINKKEIEKKKKVIEGKMKKLNNTEEECLKDFAQQLAKKNLTPEAFYRVCDEKC